MIFALYFFFATTHAVRLLRVSDCSSDNYGCIQPGIIPSPDNIGSGSLSMDTGADGMPKVQGFPGDMPSGGGYLDPPAPTEDPAERFTLAAISVPSAEPASPLEICAVEKCVRNPVS